MLSTGSCKGRQQQDYFISFPIFGWECKCSAIFWLAFPNSLPSYFTTLRSSGIIVLPKKKISSIGAEFLGNLVFNCF
jgi:hypothetical protein